MAAPQFAFKKATKEQSKLRLSIAGTAGSGKTYTALRLASELGGRVAVIDTERGSASKYADHFEFDVLELDDFHPDRYIEAIRAAERAGYDVLVIDSTTHEWNGRNGILELHENAVQRQRTKNTYTAWAEVTPMHQRFVDAILGCKCHVIASVRSKTEYVQDKNEKGYTEVRKVGMASVQREGMDYEYDVMLEMSVDHVGVVTKTRCAALDGKVFTKPGPELAEILKTWLSSGVAPAPRQVVQPPAASAGADSDQPLATVEYLTGSDLRELMELWATHVTKQKLSEYCLEKGYGKTSQIPKEAGEKLLATLRDRDEKAKAAAAAAAEITANLDAAIAQVEAAGVLADHWKDEMSRQYEVVEASDLNPDQMIAFTETLQQWAEAVSKKKTAKEDESDVPV